MNFRKTAVLSAAALLVAALGINVAEARPGSNGNFRGGGGRVVFYAAPIVAASYVASRYYYTPSYYYPPSYYYYPPAVYYPPTPPVYIEQPPPSYAVPPQSQYQQPQTPPQGQYQQPQTQPQGQYQPDSQVDGYYCQASRAYYPQVKSCSGGWQRVAPQSPAG